MGKRFKIILTILFLFGQTFSTPVKLKGGLIYKHEGVAQINQDYLTFKRQVDTSALQSVAQRLQDSTTLYKEYCKLLSSYNRKGQRTMAHEAYDKATSLNITVQYISTPLKYPLRDTTSVCSRLDARKVEIRDMATYNAARSYASERHIQQFEAGIKFNQQANRFQFISDSQVARLPSLFSHIVYGGYYTGAQHLADYEKDSYVVSDAVKYPYVYSQPTGNFVLRMADNNDRERLDYIMCEQSVTKPPPEKEAENPFIQIAAHSCKRDYTALQAQTDYTLNEIFSITNLNFTLNDEPVWTSFFPQFQPLSNTELTQTFWYNMANSNVPKPKLGPSRSLTEDQQLIRQKRDVFKPLFQPFTDSIAKEHPNPECYWTPSRTVFVPDASHFFKFPYEEWEIFSDVPRTLPDYVILMHTVWKIHVEKHYNELSFPEWMYKQGQRLKIFNLLRRSSMIHRVERNLDMIIQQNQFLLQSFMQNNRKWPQAFDLRLQRNLDYLETDIMDKLLEHQFDSLNISISDIDALSQAEFDIFVSSHFNINVTNNIISDDNENDQSNDLSNQFDDSSNLSRQKRVAPLVAPLVAGLIGGAIGGSAALLAQSFQPTANSADEAHLAALKQLATEINSLKINSQQTTNVINNVVDRLQNFEMQIMGNFEGVTSITMAMDLKALNDQLKTISQLTILKYNAALLAAADGRTSPYVLTQRELDNIVQRVQRKQSLTLTHDLSAVKTTASMENNTIIFYFEVPIIDAKKEFNLYSVVPLPVFMNGTYLPNVDSNHIAINVDGDKFTVLNDLQISACLDKPPRCESYTAITPIRTGISCVATSYISDTQSCPLFQTTSAPLPRFYFFDDIMIYSTPSQTQVFITCSPAPGQTSRRDETLTLTGYGIQQVASGCSLTLPDGTTHVTPNKMVNITEVGTQLFREIFQQPQPSIDVVYIDTQPIFSTIPRLTPLPDGEDPVLFTERLTKSFHPATVTANTTQIIIILIIVFIIAGVCYYFRRSLCCCCKTRRTPMVISDPIRATGQHTGQHWFEIKDQEPDTISQFAAMPDPAQPSRLELLRQPLQSFYSAFPAWTKVNTSDPEEPQKRRTTLEPLFHNRHAQGPLRRDPDSETPPPSIIRSNSTDGRRPFQHIKVSSNLVQKAAQQHEADRLENQRLRDEQNACHLDEMRRVSFNTETGQASAHLRQPHN